MNKNYFKLFFKKFTVNHKKETMLIQEIIIVLKIISFFITRLVYFSPRFTQKRLQLFNLGYQIVTWVLKKTMKKKEKKSL